jgi:DNA polymerase-3 subunit delta'
LIERDGINPKLASFAASAAQGHIGRAKYLATNEEARKTREKILNIPFTVTNLASAFEAANTLLELAKEQARVESEIRDEEELAKLKESYGTTGSRLATGGSKAIKELERDQKNRFTRLTKDKLDLFLIYLLDQAPNKFLENSNNGVRDLKYTRIITNILNDRMNLLSNYSVQIQLEALLIKIFL